MGGSSGSLAPSKPTMPATNDVGNGAPGTVSSVAVTSDSGSSAASHRDLLPQHPGSVANGDSSANSGSGTVTASAPGPPSTSPSTPGGPGSMGPPPPPAYHHMSAPAVIPPACVLV